MITDRALPSGWTIATLGEVATYQNGRAFKPSEWQTTGLPIIRIQNLTSESADCNYSPLQHESRFRVKHGDLLFAWSASLGAFIWRGGDAWLNQHIFRVDHAKQVSRRFLYYALTDITNTLYTKAHGSGMVHVTKRSFEETGFRLPPLNEQRRIAAKIDELLSELDKGIESLRTAHRQLTAYRQSVLKNAFEGRLTAQWREENRDELETLEQLFARIKRERSALYAQQLEKWKISVAEWEEGGKSGKKPSKPKKLPNVPGIPKEVAAKLAPLPRSWAWGLLGWMTHGVEYGTASKSAMTGNVPVLRMGNIQNAKLDWTDLVYTSDGEEIARYRLHVGDVLFNRTNSPELVGKTAIYKGERPAIFAGYLIRVNHIRSIVDGQYLNLFLNSHVARQHGNSVKTDGVNQSNINGTKLSNYPFPYCSINEQGAIADNLERAFSFLDSTEDNIVRELQRTAGLRQAILKRAFSGRLVPQDPNDEPASVLLDRIRAGRKRSAKGRRRARAVA